MALRTFRESFKWLIWIVSIAFIAWLVFELGANILNINRAKPWEQGIVAEVGDVKISSDYYEGLVQQEIQETLRVRRVESITPEEEDNIREAVFFSLVDNLRWKRLAEKYGFKLSDKAILTLIALLPPPELLRDSNFIRDGRFDYQRYLQVLNDKRYAPIFAGYEQKLRNEIPADLVRFFVSKIPIISKEEMWEKWKFENTKYGFTFVNIIYARVPDEEIKQPTDEELKKFFEKNRDKFYKPPYADMYIIRVYKNPSKEDSLQAKDLIDRAKKEALRDWKEAVRIYSEDQITKENEGELGWLALFTLPPDVRKSVEEADTGSILGPFDVPSGYNIVKVLEKKGDSVRLAHIFVSIKTSYKTKQSLRDSLMKFLSVVKKDNFLETAKKLGFRVDSTGKFDISLGFIPFIGPDRSLMTFIKNAKEGDISGIIFKPKYYIVVQVVKKYKEGVPNFDEIKDEVKKEYIKFKKKEVAFSLMKKVINELKAGENVDTLRNRYSKYGIFIGKADSTDYRSYIPGITNKEVLYRILMNIKSGDWMGPYDYDDGAYYVIKHYEIPPDRNDFEKRLVNLIIQNQQTQAMEILTNLQRELEEIMPLKDYRGYIY